MITREQVADLQPGDVVEIVEDDKGDEITHRGPLRREGKYLVLGGFTVTRPNGGPASWYRTLTVVSRAPRPLYVNHPRTEPVRGDVARDNESGNEHRVWVYGRDHGGSTWFWSEYPTEIAGHLKTVRLRLLVDGTTGQVVPS